jgi:hypothetical protein
LRHHKWWSSPKFAYRVLLRGVVLKISLLRRALESRIYGAIELDWQLEGDASLRPRHQLDDDFAEKSASSHPTMEGRTFNSSRNGLTT